MFVNFANKEFQCSLPYRFRKKIGQLAIADINYKISRIVYLILFT